MKSVCRLLIYRDHEDKNFNCNFKFVLVDYSFSVYICKYMQVISISILPVVSFLQSFLVVVFLDDNIENDK